ncbi:MAG: zinc ribbon domain-containing protein [Chloroflexota bacterium]
MNRVNWTQVGVFAVVVLLVLLIGVGMLGGFGRYGYGPGMMGPGMMGGWGFGLFGWLGMIFMWIIPLGFLTLLVAGIVWLVRAVSGSPSAGPPPPPAPLTTGICPSCGRPTQASWQHCPYCGQSLA